MRKLSRIGQNTLEYTLLIVAVFLVIFFALSPNGLITKHIKQSVELSTQAVECMPYSVCTNPNGCLPQDNNGCCESGESSTNYDCAGPEVCGNGACEYGGTHIQFWTGNGTQPYDETCATCPQDCGACFTCGDGVCQPSTVLIGPIPIPIPGETCQTCPQDCGPCGNSIDGGWCPWTNYSYCSALCGGGTQTRTRTCDCPAPANGGANCVGNAQETVACNTGLCNGNVAMPNGMPYTVTCDATLYHDYQADPYEGVGCGTPCTAGQTYNFYYSPGPGMGCEIHNRICASVNCGGGCYNQWGGWICS